MYRVAEETHDVDLLLNHNAGDLKGEAAFLSDSVPKTHGFHAIFTFKMVEFVAKIICVTGKLRAHAGTDRRGRE